MSTPEKPTDSHLNNRDDSLEEVARAENDQSAESPKKLIREIEERVARLRSSQDVSPEDLSKAREMIADLESLINKQTPEPEAKDLETPLIKEVSDLSPENKEKIRNFMHSLTLDEQLMLESLIMSNVPNLDNRLYGLKFDPAEVWQTVINRNKEELNVLFSAWSSSVTRGLNTETIDPETGQKVMITEKNWKLGPRGQWINRFKPSFESVIQKAEELRNQILS